MSEFIYIIVSTLLISIIALVGILILYFKKIDLDKVIYYLVSLAVGTFLGGAFFHLFPEASKELDLDFLYTAVLFSLIFYFILEKIIHWRHCHKRDCHVHSFGYVNLFGDGVHNFIDGLIIASAYLTDIKLGIVTTIAIALHEIPQEVGDYGVLLHAGFKKKKALMINFAVALITVLGGVFGYYIVRINENFISYLLPVAIGGFIYIAMSDLIPELREEKDKKKFCFTFIFFIVGIIVMYLTTLFE
jgi:zinc and cadmium transporter